MLHRAASVNGGNLPVFSPRMVRSELQQEELMKRFILGLAFALSVITGLGTVSSAFAGPTTPAAYQCFLDDGYAGLRPCSQGGA